MRRIRRREREAAIETAPTILRVGPLLYYPVPVLLGFGLLAHNWILGFVLAGLGLPLAVLPWDRVLVWVRRRRMQQ